MSLALLATAASLAVAPSTPHGTAWAQLRIERSVVIRVPNVVPPPARVRWRERKTLKCIPVSNLAGYAITQPDSIDLIVRGGDRFRAKLERGCPSIAFYSGFYIKPPADAKLCANRDMFHSRSGGQCEIDKLRTLVVDK